MSDKGEARQSSQEEEAQAEKPVYAPPQVVPLNKVAAGQGDCNPGSSNTFCIAGGAASVGCTTGDEV